jgi:acyl carrier protein
MSAPAPATDDQLGTRVREVLRGQFGAAIDEVPADAELAERLQGSYDSLAALECVTRIETEFGIEVDFVGHDVRYWFATTGRIVRFVADRLEDRTALGEA